MLQEVNRKLHQLRQEVLVHKKHIDKFDALSLSSLEFDEHTQRLSLPEGLGGALPELRGMCALVKELTEVLNEGYIAQQSLLSHFRREAEACAQMRTVVVDHQRGSDADLAQAREQLQRLRSSLCEEERERERAEEALLDLHDYHSLPPPLALSESENNEHAHTQSTASGSGSGSVSQKRRGGAQRAQRQLEVEVSLLEKEVRVRLKHLFEALSELVEDKLVLLRMVQDIVEHYDFTIGRIGARSGVLHVEQKLQLLVRPHLQPLLAHKLFVVKEEEELLNEVKKAWAELFLGCKEHVGLAEQDLNQLVLVQAKTGDDWVFYVKCGACLVFLLWSLSECFNNEIARSKIWNDPTFAIFMCFGDFLLLLFMWAVSMNVWRQSGIDFVKLLNLQDTEIARAKNPVLMVLQSFSQDILLFLITFIFFNKAVRGAYHSHYSLSFAHTLPTLLAVYYTYRMLSPLETRKTWLNMLWKVIAAPLYPVQFRDGFIGDLLTSLVRVMVPFVFSLVYVAHSLYSFLTNEDEWAVETSDRWWRSDKMHRFVLMPFLTLFPLWIRLVQCLRRSVETGQRWPHFGNALKYTSAIVVISYGTFQPMVRSDPIWIAGFTGATLFQFSWDIFQDWGILQVNWPSNARSPWDIFERINEVTITMRTKRLLGPRWIYIAIMLGNLVLRFAWTLPLLPQDETTHPLSPYAMIMTHATPFIAAAEIVRRMVWGFLRLEWEQIEVLQKANLIDLLDEDIEVAAPVNGNAKLSSSPSSANWMSALPPFLLEIVQNLRCLDNATSQMRLFESIVFAAFVLYIISVAAWPALFST